MGLRDRDYMKEQPDEEAYRKYDKEIFDAEYAGVDAKRKATIRRVALAFVVVLLLVIIGSVVVSIM